MNYHKFVVVDVETNGLSPEENEIIDIGLVRINGTAIADEYSTLIRPINAIPPIITSLTGISNKDVKQAPSFGERAADILKFIGDDILVGHNVNFDISMINTALYRLELPPLKNQTIDTLNLYALIAPTGKSYKLEDIATNFLNQKAEFHKAIHDARITASVFLLVLERLQKFPINILFHLNLLFHNSTSIYASLIQRIYRSRARHVTDTDVIGYDWTSLIQNENSSFEQISETCLVSPPKTPMQQIIQKAFNQPSFLFWECPQTHDAVEEIINLVRSRSLSSPIAIAVTSLHQQNAITRQLSDIQSKNSHFTFSVIEHPEQYVCLTKVDLLLHQISNNDNTNDIIDFAPLLTWLSQTKTGGIMELHKKISSRFQKHIAVEVDLCHDYKCPHNADCFWKKSLSSAMMTNIMVVHLQMLINRPSTSHYLPNFDHLIILNSHLIIPLSASLSLATYTARHTIKQLTMIQETIQTILENIIDQTDVTEMPKNIINSVSQTVTLLLSHMVTTSDNTNRLFDYLLKIPHYTRQSKNKKIKKINVNQELFSMKEWQRVESTSQYISNLVMKSIDILMPLLKILEPYHDNSIKTLKFILIDLKIRLFSFQNMLQLMRSEIPGCFSWVEVRYQKNGPSAYFNVINQDTLKRFKTNLATKKNVIFISPNIAVCNNLKYFSSQFIYPHDGRVVSEYISPIQLNNILCFRAIYKPSETVMNLKAEQHKIIEKIVNNFNTRILIVSRKHSRLQTAFYHLTSKILNPKRVLLKQEINKSNNTNLSVYKNTANSIFFIHYDYLDKLDMDQIKPSVAILLDLPIDDITDIYTNHQLATLKKCSINWMHHYVLPNASLRFRTAINTLHRENSHSVLIDLGVKSTQKYFSPYFTLPNTTFVEMPESTTLLNDIRVWLN